MRLVFFILAILSFATVSTSQGQTDPVQQKSGSEKPIYQLFPTQNYWTFIKLNTRNGIMRQVHFTVKEDGQAGEEILNIVPLVSEAKEVNGRFTLYPTENIYNFLLLDQISGAVYQVQWSFELRNRGVFPIK